MRQTSGWMILLSVLWLSAMTASGEKRVDDVYYIPSAQKLDKSKLEPRYNKRAKELVFVIDADSLSSSPVGGSQALPLMPEQQVTDSINNR